MLLETTISPPSLTPLISPFTTICFPCCLMSPPETCRYKTRYSSLCVPASINGGARQRTGGKLSLYFTMNYETTLKFSARERASEKLPLIQRQGFFLHFVPETWQGLGLGRNKMVSEVNGKLGRTLRACRILWTELFHPFPEFILLLCVK